MTIPTSTWNTRLDPRTSIRYVDVSAVSREDLSVVSDSKYSADNAPSRARKIVETGDTIFATVRPSLRRIAQISASLDGEIVSTAFCVLRPDSTQLHPEYLYFAMQIEAVADGIAAMQTGASYPAVRDADVFSQAIPVPPLQDQIKIAHALNQLRASMLQQSKCERVALELKRAAMHSLFTRGLRSEAQKETEIGMVPESWGVKSIRDHFHVLSGGTPSRRNPEYWANGRIPWVKTTEIDYCVIDQTDEHITEAGLDNSSAKLLPPETLLMAMFGQGVTRGKVAMLGIEASCNQACAAMIPQDCEIGSRYLYHFLSFSYESIRQKAHGGQQQNLNLGIVGDLPVAVPESKDTQQEIVDILETIDRKIDLHRRKRVVLDELFKASLHGLMTGEIGVGEIMLTNTHQNIRRSDGNN